MTRSDDSRERDERGASTLRRPPLTAPDPELEKTPGTALDWLEHVRDRAERVRVLRASAELAARSALDACDRALESLQGWRQRLESRREELREQPATGIEIDAGTPTDLRVEEGSGAAAFDAITSSSGGVEGAKASESSVDSSNAAAFDATAGMSNGRASPLEATSSADDTSVNSFEAPSSSERGPAV